MQKDKIGPQRDDDNNVMLSNVTSCKSVVLGKSPMFPVCLFCLSDFVKFLTLFYLIESFGINLFMLKAFFVLQISILQLVM